MPLPPLTSKASKARQVALGSQRLEDCALAIVAAVVSTPAPDRAVIDAGSKALSADLRVVGLNGFGRVLGRDYLTVTRLSGEHAVLIAQEQTKLIVGDRLLVIPTHACTVVNLHEALIRVSRDSLGKWLPISARGWQEYADRAES